MQDEEHAIFEYWPNAILLNSNTIFRISYNILLLWIRIGILGNELRDLRKSTLEELSIKELKLPSVNRYPLSPYHGILADLTECKDEQKLELCLCALNPVSLNHHFDSYICTSDLHLANQCEIVTGSIIVCMFSCM